MNKKFTLMLAHLPANRAPNTKDDEAFVIKLSGPWLSNSVPEESYLQYGGWFKRDTTDEEVKTMVLYMAEHVILPHVLNVRKETPEC